MFVTVMTGHHHRITLLGLVMAGGTLGNTELRMLFVSKGHITEIAVKYDDRFLIGDDQFTCDYAASVHGKQGNHRYD
jgi:hypothetical protein